MNLKTLTDAELYAYMLAAQAIQKRNPPDSQEWQDASRDIYAVCAENARRYGGVSTC